MKALLISLTAGLLLAMSYPSFSTTDPALLAKMEACFKAHALLMGKPALMTRAVCWRAHGYLMSGN